MTQAVVRLEPREQAVDLVSAATYIRSCITTTTKSIIAAGRELRRVKEHLGHGRFLDWIDAELNMTARTAQNYLRAAEWAEGKDEIISHLPPTTVYRLAAPSTPRAVSEKVVNLLRQGEGCDPRSIETFVRQESFLEREKIRRREQRQAARSRKRESPRAVKKNQDRVEGALGMLISCLEHAADLDVSYLSADSAGVCAAAIRESRKNIKVLLRRLEEHAATTDKTEPTGTT